MTQQRAYRRWENVVPYSNFNWILDNLAVGGRIDDYTDLPFDAILCLQAGGDGDELLPPPEDLRDLLTHEWLPMTDGPTTGCLDRFEEAAQLIEAWHRQGKRVLVHCYAGVSRSASAVIYYLMRVRGLRYDDALAIVRAARVQAFPNPGFTVALHQYQGVPLDRDVLQDLMDKWRIFLRDEYALELDDALFYRDVGWQPELT